MLAGVQGAERDTHAKADGGTDSDDKKDFRQQAAVRVVQEVNAGCQNDGGCEQDQADGSENADTCTVDVSCLFMIFTAKGIGHVGEDGPGKSQIEEAVIADERHRDGPDAVLFGANFMQRERHDKEADGGENYHSQHAAA